MIQYDLVVRGGRLVDPAHGVDAVLDLAIDGAGVAAIGTALQGRRELDAVGCVVAPGFVDLHSHAQDLTGHRLQALDGVTTTLELEAGVGDVARAYEEASREGRPLHHGFSVSWAAARMAVLADVQRTGSSTDVLANLGQQAWQQPVTPREQQAVLAVLDDGLAAGALGVGVLLGYAPESDPAELHAVAAAAAAVGRPLYTHARDLVEMRPQVVVDGAEEIVRLAGETGAAMHWCHVNSTSLRAVDRVLGLVEDARVAGSRISTEAYPYGAGSTAVGAAFLSPDRLGERRLRPQDIVLAATSERVRDARHLQQLRAEDPGALCLVHLLDEELPEDLAHLITALTSTDACIASDAMPMSGPFELREAWPPAPRSMTHPRSAGTFARSYRWLVRERSVWDVVEHVRRCSTLPGELLALATGGHVCKGRLGVGDDADVVVFDPDAYSDRATYRKLASSVGVRHLLVDGQEVVRSGELQLHPRPGRGLRA